MLNLTPTDCRVNDLRIREILTNADRHATLRHDAPTSRQRVSIVSRLALTLTRPVQSLVPRRSSRPGMLAIPRT